MWTDIFTAVSLILVLEGLFAFAAPATMKEYLKTILDRDDQTLRIVGLCSMIVGAVLISFIR